MKRLSSILSALVFGAGMLVVPALHAAHCAACHDAHDAGNCPVCQLAGTPAVAAIPHVDPAPQTAVADRVSIPDSFAPSFVLSRTAQARAPPIA